MDTVPAGFSLIKTSDRIMAILKQLMQRDLNMPKKTLYAKYIYAINSVEGLSRKPLAISINE
jgi:hypothetical protein